MIDANAALSQYVDVYAYEFNDPYAPPTSATPAVTVEPNDQYGYPTAAEHGSELQYLFKFPFTSSLTSDEQQLESEMQAYWANFVTNRNPNKGTTEATWPTFKSTQKILDLVPGPPTPTASTGFSKDHFCSVWEPIISAEAQF
jgi:para-nitrobenzyl esterase